MDRHFFNVTIMSFSLLRGFVALAPIGRPCARKLEGRPHQGLPEAERLPGGVDRA